MKMKRVLSFILAGVLLLGATVLPGQADQAAPAQTTLTLEQAVDLAVKNNPQVALAEANKTKTHLSYTQAHKTSNKISDSSRHTYAENQAEYLAPKIAERQEQQADKVYTATVNGVKIQAESAFYELLKAQEDQTTAENALERADAQVKIANAKYEVGSVAKVELLNAQAAQAGTRASLTSAQNTYKQKMMELNKVIGLDLNTVITPQGAFQFNKETFDLNQLLDTAKTGEISIIKAQDTYEIAKWSYDFAKGYYGGGNYDVKKSEQDMISAQLSLKQTSDNVITTVNQTYQGLLATEEQYQYLLKAVDLSREAYRLKQASYEVGMATLEEAQQASDDVQSAEAKLSQCIYSYNTIKSSLKYNIYS